MQTQYSAILYIHPHEIGKDLYANSIEGYTLHIPHGIGKDLYAIYIFDKINYTDVTPAAADSMLNLITVPKFRYKISDNTGTTEPRRLIVQFGNFFFFFFFCLR